MTGGILVCKTCMDLEIPFLNFYLVISLARNSQKSGESVQKHLHPGYEFCSLVKNKVKVKNCLNKE